MPDTLLDYVRAAAGHELLGESSLVAGTATGGSALTLVDTGRLLTHAQDHTYNKRWLYLWSGSNAGSSRFVSNYAGDTGTLTWTSNLGAAVASGDEYLLLRDFRFEDWAEFANETLKNLFYPLQVSLRGESTLLMYSLPTPLSEARYVNAVRVGKYPFRWTNEREAKVRWYALEPRWLSVEQQLYLVLDGALTASQQLVFECQVPYAHPHMSAFTMTRSVATPFGETVAHAPPRQLVVLGMVWRALVKKATNLTGAPKELWVRQARTAARRYAEALGAGGVKRVGLRLEYAEPW